MTRTRTRYMRYAVMVTVLIILIQAACVYLMTHGLRPAGFAMLCVFTVIGLIAVLVLGYAAFKEQ